MTTEEFRKHAHQLVDWMADYYENIERYPVRSQVEPGEIEKKLPSHAPRESEDFASIFEDFEHLIVPGITHWQHPSFFAYFPANSSYPSVLAEMLTATLAAQCMIWQTSPAATELEERVMEWLREMIGLPADFHGVIQDTASTSTLVAILTARERATDFGVNARGLKDRTLTAYCSAETHSSIEKGVKIAGIGEENLRKIAVDQRFALIPSELDRAIEEDKRRGMTPVCVVATIGTTGSTAVDPLAEIAAICKKHGVWLHVDAALAGSALILPEHRSMIGGIEAVDSFTFNPHKWLFTNFDCSAYFVRDKESLLKTFEIHPEYLKTSEGKTVNNYRDWGVQLGRRFRALKLWFVIRSYGVAGLQKTIRAHIKMAHELARQIDAEDDFELLAPVPLNTVCFRHIPPGITDEATINRHNAELLARLNDSGKLYLTHTKLRGVYTIRFVVGQTRVEQRHVDSGWELIKEMAHG
ncbi:MAG: pyridoxal phosphate-dependent decarboxylase family protein [Spirochaetales bacterium]